MPHKIVVTSMGGTIAGVGLDPASTTSYRPARLSAAELLAALPPPPDGVTVEPDEFYPVESAGLTSSEWLRTSAHIGALLSDGADGVVITHGTDTMEETAYFLNLTVRSKKPVILTGAMRPSTAVSADGPSNLYQAIQAAASDRTAGLGTIIAMNGVLIAARDARKNNPVRPDAFVPREFGELGVIVDGRVEISYRSAKRHSFESEFNIAGMTNLPDVRIVPMYAGTPTDLLDFYLSHGVRGLVLDCVGNGNLGPIWREAVPSMTKRGMAIVRCTRTDSGFVNRNGAQDDDRLGTVAGGSLTAVKARILLMLALAHGIESPAELQKRFDIY